MKRVWIEVLIAVLIIMSAFMVAVYAEEPPTWETAYEVVTLTDLIETPEMFDNRNIYLEVWVRKIPAPQGGNQPSTTPRLITVGKGQIELDIKVPSTVPMFADIQIGRPVLVWGRLKLDGENTHLKADWLMLDWNLFK